MKRITIKEIAQKAGLSIATVSRAMNPDTQAMVKKSTLDKVRAIIEKENYIPSLCAQRLVTGKSYNIVLLFKPNFKSAFFNDYYSKIITGAMNAIQGTKYQLLISIIDDNEGAFKVEEALKTMDVAGAVLCNFTGVFNVSARNIFNANIPIIIINQFKNLKNSHCFTIDHFSGGYDATKYLIGRGHKSIGFIRGLKAVKDAEDRFEGFQKAMKDSGLDVKKEFIFKGNLEEPSGKEAARYYMKKLKVRPTAVFSANDQMALGFINQCVDMGVRCPEEISIVGFDGIDAGRYTNPPLTTVRQPGYEMAKEAVIQMCKLIDQNKDFSGTKHFKSKIIERGSVKTIS